eukprot:1086407-Pyramimonas_sp.AAC.1
MCIRDSAGQGALAPEGDGVALGDGGVAGHAQAVVERTGGAARAGRPGDGGAAGDNRNRGGGVRRVKHHAHLPSDRPCVREKNKNEKKDNRAKRETDTEAQRRPRRLPGVARVAHIR